MNTKMKREKNLQKNPYEIQFNGTIESNANLRNQIKSSRME